MENTQMVGLRTAGRLRETAENSPQRDLFTGEWEAKPPRRGNGSHVRLKRLDREMVAVAGMAAPLGEGPVGKFCKGLP
jgi:hypothetical protein